ncbi:MAG: hypothetical protein ACP5HZ_11580 [Ferrimicrobium sp.]
MSIQQVLIGQSTPHLLLITEYFYTYPADSPMGLIIMVAISTNTGSFTDCFLASW